MCLFTPARRHFVTSTNFCTLIQRMFWDRLIKALQHGFASRRNQHLRCAEFSLKNDAELFSEYRPSISIEFALKICFVSFFNMAMALKAVHEPPLQRITPFICMMDPRCAQSVSKSVQLQSSISNHFRLTFALKILCVSILNMAIALSAEHAQPQRIIAYECMNQRCAHSFSNMHNYDVHRYNARNVGTLCARAPHNAARNCCDATFGLDHNGDQAHSVQRQAVHMHSHRANDSRAVPIISFNFYFSKNY